MNHQTIGHSHEPKGSEEAQNPKKTPACAKAVQHLKCCAGSLTTLARNFPA